jgi:nucleoside-diphosphate-sugar epimerase
VGAAMELGARLLRPFVELTPLVTRSSVHILCTDIAFKTDRAERELGYRPPYDAEQSFLRTVAWFREHGPVDR